MTTLSGKTALVTGASRGIGRAASLALAKGGAQVLVHYGHGKAAAEAVVGEIREAGGRSGTVAADLAVPDGPHKLASEVRAIIGERLDILVANAGVSKAAPIEETTVEDFDHLFAVNVRAPFFLVQQLLPILREGSSIVLLSSLAARAVVAGGAGCRRYALCVCREQRCRRHARETFRSDARATRRPGECRRAGCRPDRHVALHQDRCGTRLHARHAGLEAPRRAGGRCRCGGIPRIR